MTAEYTKGKEYLYRHPITKEEYNVVFEACELEMLGAVYIFSHGQHTLRLPETRVIYDIMEKPNQDILPEPEPTPETLYKVLMFDGKYVDVNNIHNGTLVSINPILLPYETTLDSLIEKTRTMYNTFNPTRADIACANLRLCYLAEVEVKIIG